jgi:dTDP-4-dehydrorhamnose 3,5-epimerase
MGKLRVVSHVRIPTKGPEGRPNGAVISIWNIHEQRLPDDRLPQQVYVTIVAPRGCKGPHLHLKRWGFFTCIRGNVRIVARTESGYEVADSGDDHGYATIEVPAGVPALIENLGETDAYVINTPAPAWRPDDLDEHPVENWDYHG